jgi:hypothetical protein
MRIPIENYCGALSDHKNSYERSDNPIRAISATEREYGINRKT